MDKLEANKKILTRYVEALNAGDIETLREIFAPDSTVQGVLGKGALDAVVPIWRMLHDSLKLHLKIESMVAQGDEVAVRYTRTEHSSVHSATISRPGNLTSWWRLNRSSCGTARFASDEVPATPSRKPAKSAFH